MRLISKNFKRNFIIRNTHQDGLENFFGCEKSCNQSHKAPVAMHFRTGYATMIINNITCSNSISTNCEKDSTIPLLNDLHKFFFDFKEKIGVVNDDNSDVHCKANDMLETIVFDPQFSELNVTENDTLPNNSHTIFNKVFKKIACENCGNSLEFLDKDARGPSPVFLKNIQKFLSEVNQMIPHICSEKSLRKTMISMIDDMEIGCPEHYEYVSLILKEISINYALVSFCQNINSLLSGKTKSLPDEFNHMQDLAFQFQIKKRRIGKFTDKFLP